MQTTNPTIDGLDHFQVRLVRRIHLAPKSKLRMNRKGYSGARTWQGIKALAASDFVLMSESPTGRIVYAELTQNGRALLPIIEAHDRAEAEKRAARDAAENAAAACSAAAPRMLAALHAAATDLKAAGRDERNGTLANVLGAIRAAEGRS